MPKEIKLYKIYRDWFERYPYKVTEQELLKNFCSYFQMKTETGKIYLELWLKENKK